MARVVATARGVYLSEKAVGEEFDFPDHLLTKGRDGKPVYPSWFKPAEPVAAAPAVKREPAVAKRKPAATKAKARGRK